MVHANAYESGAQKAIPAVLVYLRCEGRILMVHREGRAGDHHEGKCNGLGGKLELGEGVWQAAHREVAEESGLQLGLSRLTWLGFLHFPNFKPQKKEDWLVTVFVADVTAAEQAQCWAAGPEGRLNWVPESEIMALPLWEGDRQFLPYVLARKPFAGTLWYENGIFMRHELVLLQK